MELKKARRIEHVLQPPATPDPLPGHSAAPNELPTFASLTKSAQEEMSRQMATALQGRREAMAVDATATPSWDYKKDNEMLFDRVCAEARRRARQKGSSTVSYRDIRESSQAMDTSFGNKKIKSPSEEQPEHIDEVVESLATLRAETLRLSRGGDSTTQSTGSRRNGLRGLPTYSGQDVPRRRRRRRNLRPKRIHVPRNSPPRE